MNIGGIMRGLLGDLQAGDSRTIELKPGQTLRGVVVNLLEGDEAIVQLGGQQVRAKLELPLQPGQSTMLQVQAETQNGIVVLRPVDPGSAQMPEAAMRDLVRSLGLPDKSWARQLMLDMKRDGVPLNRELAAAFTQASAEMPKQADPQQWLQAAALAFKRGLPMTAATITALQQAMFGRPAHELLDGLQSQLRTFLAGADAQQGGSGTQQLATRLLALLEQGLPLLRLAAESGQGGPTTPGSSGSAGAAGHAGQGNGGSVAQGNAASALQGNAASTGTGNAAAMPAGGVGAGPVGLGTSAGAPVGQGNAASTAPGNAGAVSLGNAAAGAAGSNAATHQVLGTSINGGPSATSLPGGGAPGAGATAAGSPSNPAGSAMSTGQTAPGHASGLAAGAGNAMASHTPSAGIGASAGSGGPSSSAALPGSSAGVGSPAGGFAGQAASGSASAGNAAAAGAAGAGAPTGASGWVGEMLRWLGVDHERQLLMRPAPGSAPGAAGASAGGAQPPATSGADGQPLADRAAALAERAPGLPSGGPAGAAAAHAAEAGRPAAAQETLKGALLQLAARDDAPPALREAAQQLLQQVTGQQLLLSAERGGAMMSHLSIFIPLHAQDGNQTASVHIQTRRGRKGEIDASNCRLLFDLQMKQLGDTLVDVQVVDKIVSLTIWNDHPAIARLLETSRGQLAEAMTRSGYQLLTLRSTPLPSAEEREDAQAKKGMLAGSAQLPDRGGYAAKPYRGVDLRA